MFGIVHYAMHSMHAYILNAKYLLKSAQYFARHFLCARNFICKRSFHPSHIFAYLQCCCWIIKVYMCSNTTVHCFLVGNWFDCAGGDRACILGPAWPPERHARQDQYCSMQGRQMLQHFCILQGVGKGRVNCVPGELDQGATIRLQFTIWTTMHSVLHTGRKQ